MKVLCLEEVADIISSTNEAELEYEHGWNLDTANKIICRSNLPQKAKCLLQLWTLHVSLGIRLLLLLSNLMLFLFLECPFHSFAHRQVASLLHWAEPSAM